MFREQVREFAEKEVRPLVAQMDKEAQIPRAIIDKCFELGIMGIEIPEQYGGAGATFFMSVLVVEELARVDASVAVLVDVQNTLVNNALLRWGSDDQKARYFPKLASEVGGCLRAVRGGLGLRRLRAGLPRRRQGRPLRADRPQALDHERGRGRAVHRDGQRRSRARATRASPPSWSSARSPASVGKKEDKLGIRASSTCELILEGCRVPRENVLGEVGKGYKIAIETLNEGRIGIGAQMVGVAQGAFEHGAAVRAGAPAVRQAHRRVPGACSSCSPSWPPRSRPRGCSPTTRPACATRGASFIKEAAMAKLFASRTAEHVTSKVIEIYGGYGFTPRVPGREVLPRPEGRARSTRAPRNMQLLVIAKQLLGKL